MSYPINMCDQCNPEPNSGCTLCTGDKTNNIWFSCGKCRLDELSYEQVYFILQKVPQAKPDLLRITSDPTLIELAQQSELIKDPIEDDLIPSKMINDPKRTLPYYTFLMGNVDGSIIGK